MRVTTTVTMATTEKINNKGRTCVWTNKNRVRICLYCDCCTHSLYIIMDDMEQLNCLTLRRLTFMPDHVYPVYLDYRENTIVHHLIILQIINPMSWGLQLRFQCFALLCHRVPKNLSIPMEFSHNPRCRRRIRCVERWWSSGHLGPGW